MDDIPSVSDLSDLDSDSHDDESYHPKVADDSSCPADNESEEIDEELLGEVGGVVEDIDDEILPDGDGAEPMVCPAGPAEDASANGHLGPLVKRRRLARERSQRVLCKSCLTALSRLGAWRTATAVSVFLKMFGANNFSLLTQKAARTIKRNKSPAAIGEREVKQVLGILMYMSIVTLPCTKMCCSAS